MLPGPSVMTNIWPMPTMTEKAAKVSAACDRPERAGAAGKQDRDEPDDKGGNEGPDPGLANRAAKWSSALLPLFEAVEQQPERQHDDQDRALRADLPVRRDPQEGQERAGKRQRQRADDRADRARRGRR